MTIASRNAFIKLAITLSILLVILSITISVIFFIQGNDSLVADGIRPAAFLNNIPITPHSSLATLLSIILLPSFAVFLLMYTLFSFEKTQSIEMLFFAVSIFATAFEAFRAVFIFQSVSSELSQLILPISRLIIMSRFFVHLTLLTGILLSTKKASQEVGTTLFLLAFFSFLIANSLPFNSGSTSTSLVLISGYIDLLHIFLGVFALLTTLSYAIHGKTKNILEYSQAALGLFLFFIGYFFLKNCDSWFFLALGGFFFLIGSKKYLSSMHRYYLWQ